MAESDVADRPVDSGQLGTFLVVGALVAAAGWAVDWAVSGSDRVPAIWLLVERLSGEHGFRDWMSFLGILCAGFSAHELFERRRGLLARLPTLLIAAGAGAFAWYSWAQGRWILAGAAALFAFMWAFASPDRSSSS